MGKRGGFPRRPPVSALGARSEPLWRRPGMPTGMNRCSSGVWAHGAPSTLFNSPEPSHTDSRHLPPFSHQPLPKKLTPDAEVSRAYACLSDPQKRAQYDQHGEEVVPGAPGPRGGGMYAQPGIDPEDLFNMFFGGNPFMGQPGPRVYRTHFGGPFHAQRRQAAGAGGGASLPPVVAQLLQLAPLLILLLIGFLSRPSAPLYSLHQAGDYAAEMTTARFGVPYFVQNRRAFEAEYPPRSPARWVGVGWGGAGGCRSGPRTVPGRVCIHWPLAVDVAVGKGRGREREGLARRPHSPLLSSSPPRITASWLLPPCLPHPLPTWAVQGSAGEAGGVGFEGGAAAAVLRRAHAAAAVQVLWPEAEGGDYGDAILRRTRGALWRQAQRGSSRRLALLETLDNS